MKKLICILFFLLAVELLPAPSYSQAPPAESKRKQEKEQRRLRKLNGGNQPDRPNKMQVSTLAGLNVIEFKMQFSHATGSPRDQTFKNRSLATKLNVDYFISAKAGPGVSYNRFITIYEATDLVGREPNPYYGTQFNNAGDGFIYYYDRVTLTTTGNVLSGGLTYKPVQYSKKKQAFEVVTRAGLSVAIIHERQELVASIRKENATGTISYGQQIAKYNFNRAACTGFINAQLLIHATRYFSIVIADLTQNFGLINPTVPETSVTVDNSKTVTAAKHKISASGFTIAAGLAVHF